MNILQLPSTTRTVTSSTSTFVEMLRRQIRESRLKQADQGFISLKRTKSMENLIK